MSTERLSASLILTRGPIDDPEVYLVRRSPDLKFFGDFWVFPGGNVCNLDYFDPDDDLMQVLKRCAVRETFEETGLLSTTLYRDFSNEEKLSLKRSILKNENHWQNVLAAQSENLTHINPVFRIITPPFSPLRYDTQFFHLHSDSDETPQIDHHEIIQDCYMRPADAIKAWNNGEIKIAPPALHLLSLLEIGKIDNFATLAQKSDTALQQGDLHQIYFSPGIFIAPLSTDTIPPATTTNTLIVGSNTLYIVDPATPHAQEQQRLFDQLDRMLESGCELKGILLTHHHPDHVGAVNELSQRYQLPVHAHPLCYERIQPGYIVGKALDEGDIIDLGSAPDGSANWHLSVLHTPGHAADHLCFIDSRYRSAIVGDMLSTVSTILIDPPEGHMNSYLASLQRLLNCNINALYPAHGPAKADGSRLIEYYLKHRAEREKATLDALSHSPQAIETILPKVYADIPERVYPLAKRSLLAELIKLEEDGLCYRSDERWLLR